MKKVKSKLSEKWDALDKDKIKTKLKKAGVVVGIGAAGLMGYKCGAEVTRRLDGLAVAKFLYDHPEVKEPFEAALRDEIGN